jgi:MFS family permease
VPRLTRTTTAARAAVDGTRSPRHDVLVQEAELAPGRYVATVGPYASYERTVTEEGDQLTEVLHYRLAPGFPGGMLPLAWLHRRALRRPSRGRVPWWAPTQVLDARAASTLGALATIAVVAGYLGTILTQTVTFAADDFDASKTAQSTALAVVRVGVLATMLITAFADRRGRRRLLLLCASIGCAVCALGALAPNLGLLTADYLVVRTMVAACSVLLVVIVAEAMPAGARAYGVTILGLSGSLGVGACLIALPLADLAEPAWRILYVLPLLGLPAIAWAGRLLPESRRYEVPHDDVAMRGHTGRLWLLAVSALLLNLFKDPASQLLNEFLRDERSFSAARISAFNILTNLPGLVGVIIGGRLADAHGRRGVGAVAVVGGTLFLTAQMVSSGWEMWVLSLVGSIIAAASLPALGVYGPELFPTSLRGRANGVIAAMGVVGTVTGLLVAGVLSDRWDGLGAALVPLMVGPLIVGVLLLVAYPETAKHELEELNPEDPVVPTTVSPVPPPSP